MLWPGVGEVDQSQVAVAVDEDVVTPEIAVTDTLKLLPVEGVARKLPHSTHEPDVRVLHREPPRSCSALLFERIEVPVGQYVVLNEEAAGRQGPLAVPGCPNDLEDLGNGLGDPLEVARTGKISQ